MTPHLAQLPELGYVILGCVALALAGGLGANWLLREARQFRTAWADELKREIGAAKEPAPVNIQQPLEIRAHVGFTPIDKHESLAKDLDELKEQRRKDVAGLHLKIEQGLDGVRKDIAAEFKEVRGDMADRREDIAKLQTETTTQTRQLNLMDRKIDELPLKLKTLLGL